MFEARGAHGVRRTQRLRSQRAVPRFDDEGGKEHRLRHGLGGADASFPPSQAV